MEVDLMIDWRLVTLIITIAVTAGFNAERGPLPGPAGVPPVPISRARYLIGYLVRALLCAAGTLAAFYVFRPNGDGPVLGVMTIWLLLAAANYGLTAWRVGRRPNMGWVFLVFWVLIAALGYVWGPPIDLKDFWTTIGDAGWVQTP